MTRMVRFVAVLAAASLFGACAAKRKPLERKPGPSSGAEPDVRGEIARAVPELKEIRFAYDSDRLDEESRAVLKANAAWLKSKPGVLAQVAGHCDERGTVAYNLALGQRRARSVRDYYRALGVDGARVATISYGRERPLCREASEGCWARNRRAETLLVGGEPMAGSASPPLRSGGSRRR